MFVSVSNWVLVLNYWNGNEFDLHKNTQLISIWMVVHQHSLWNWVMQQLGNGLLNVHLLYAPEKSTHYPSPLKPNKIRTDRRLYAQRHHLAGKWQARLLPTRKKIEKNLKTEKYYTFQRIVWTVRSQSSSSSSLLPGFCIVNERNCFEDIVFSDFYPHCMEIM